jgi:DNA-binding NarL/FixJ family response regulator
MPLDQAITLALAGQADPARPAGGAPPSASSGRLDGLTPREREVALLIARGSTNRQIAEELVISEGTAANHVQRIRNKLGFGSRAQVATWAIERGLTSAIG